MRMLPKRLRPLRLFCGALCLLGLLLAIPSCGKREITASELLEELLAVSGDMPDGVTYRKGAEEGDGDYPSPSLLQALYGEKATELLSATEDYALYLSSFAVPGEIAVFRAYSKTDAQKVAALCLERADELKVLLRESGLPEAGESIRWLLRDELVVMGLVPEAEAFEAAAERLLGEVT